MTERIPFPDHAWPLMKRALEHIAGHPDEFWMSVYVHVSKPPFLDEDGEPDPTVTDYERYTGRPYPACGTVACLAGRILIESGADPRKDAFDGHSARAALGMPDEEGEYGWYPAGDAGQALFTVFNMTSIRTYAALCNALEDRFTFPEPLPADSVVTP